jgi:hypothetical protein
MLFYSSTNSDNLYDIPSPVPTSFSYGFTKRNLLIPSDNFIGPRRVLTFQVKGDPLILDLTDASKEEWIQKIKDDYEKKDILWTSSKPSSNPSFRKILLNQGSTTPDLVWVDPPIDSIFLMGGSRLTSGLVKKYFLNQGVDAVKDGMIVTFLDPQKSLDLISITPQDYLLPAVIELMERKPIDDVMKKYKIRDKNQLLWNYNQNKKNKVEWIKDKIHTFQNGNSRSSH